VGLKTDLNIVGKRKNLFLLPLALASPTSGGRSVGVVRLQTEAMELLELPVIKSIPSSP
jgi:hypothetical protein